MRWVALSVVAPLLLSLAACTGMVEAVQDPQTVSESIEVGEAELIKAEIHMPAGNLEVLSGAKKLVEGDFTFTSPHMRPEVSYDETGFRGRLNIRASGRRGGILGRQHNNRWTVRLNKETPLDLSIKMGAGEGDLELAGLDLRNVEVDIGAGTVDLDLAGGNWTRDFDVKIRGGVGEANVRVPKNIGVVAEAKGGIGEVSVRGMRKRGDRWYSYGYDDSDVTIRLDIKGGIGSINIVSVG